MIDAIFKDRVVISRLTRDRSLRIPVVERDLMKNSGLQPTKAKVAVEANNRNLRPNKLRIASLGRYHNNSNVSTPSGSRAPIPSVSPVCVLRRGFPSRAPAIVFPNQTAPARLPTQGRCRGL